MNSDSTSTQEIDGKGRAVPASEDNETKTRDKLFFHTLVTFRVENCLFRIPRGAIEAESKVFSDMFALAQPESNSSSVQVCSCAQSLEQESIDLHHISKSAFHDLLLILYPPTIRTLSSSILDDWKLEKLLPVLELAHMWEIPSVMELLNKRLDILYPPWKPLYEDCVDEILAIHKYHLDSRRLRAYVRLAKRERTFSSEDCDKLGQEVALKMIGVRERYLVSREKKYKDAYDALRKEFASCVSEYERRPRGKASGYMRLNTSEKFKRSGSEIDMSEVESTLVADLRSNFGLPESLEVEVISQAKTHNFGSNFGWSDEASCPWE